jgi:mono/diheme cytochrome c family protein
MIVMKNRITVLLWFLIFIFIMGWVDRAPAIQESQPFKPEVLPQDGKALYEKACMACHGADGRGASPERVGFETPLPDFTDCNFATREGNTDWSAVAAEGGPGRAFSKVMPAFGDALTDEQIAKILNYMRHFCAEKEWPRGELNLPRPLFTTKAFPEDEVVFTSTIKTAGNDRILNKLVYEKRIGARNQVEVVLPFGWRQHPVSQDSQDTEWQSSIGDIALSGKRVLYASLDTGAIVSLGGELLLPTGDDDKGFGNGTAVFEPYIAYGQILPKDFFLQFQGGGAVSFNRDKADNEAFWKLATGKSFYEGHFGRRWTPMVEILGSRALISNGDTHWDVVPQFQVTLSRRQHVRLNIGARIPVNDRDVRDTEIGFYLLWDWFDGGLFEGW